MLFLCCHRPAPEALDWRTVNDFAYQLQNTDLAAIGNTKFDLCVIDYSQDGSDEARFTAAEIAGLKASSGGAKLVLAYLSIGEAENYRWYWQEAWDADHDGEPDPGAPGWLGLSNPNWEGNYKVRYWDTLWQAVVLAYVDRVIAAGFDGVYLDVINAWEYWGPGGESGLNRPSAEQEMVEFVKTIADHARSTNGKAGFGIFPQNGEALCSHADYVQTVTGIGREDVWYNDDDPQAPDETAAALAGLDVFRQAGKLVLVTDYAREPAHINDLYARAAAKGYVSYATVRDLDSLTINPGHEPD